MNSIDINWEKVQGLIPAIVQDSKTHAVLMLGYMNPAALEKTLQERRVTFFSRTKNRLWTKGETSGNYLELQSITMDCDNDSILIQADPKGPTCHTGATTCFSSQNISETGLKESSGAFLDHLFAIISERKNSPSNESYTSQLFRQGLDRIAQKVGEEAIETVIAAKNNNNEDFQGEAADLIYHLLVLVKAKNLTLNDVVSVLKSRHK